MPLLRVTDSQAVSRRISRRYVETYGCAPFRGMTTTDEMVAWCIAEGLGDTVAADVVPGCRPDETSPPCERFWICE